MRTTGLRSTLAIGLLIGLAACSGKQEQDTTGQLSPLPGGSGTASSAASSAARPDAPTYELPNGWVRQKPMTTMRVEEFKLPGKGDGGDAEMAVFHFPGTGGSVQDNIDRWIGQFTQPDGSSSKDASSMSTFEVADHEVTMVDVAGTYDPGMMSTGSGPMPRHRMLAAIIVAPDGPWFYKLVGPAATVDSWQSSFEQFAHSLRLP